MNKLEFFFLFISNCSSEYKLLISLFSISGLFGFEDELSDNGISEGRIRFRIMDDCFMG